MAAALKITDIHKSFRSDFYRKKKHILKGISLDIEEGEIFGYLGPNGAGKTTTIKCIMGLIFPEKGEMEILGHDNLSLEAKAQIGYLPENPYFYDYLTAEEFLGYYSQLHSIKKKEQEKKIQELLKLVGLKDSVNLQLRKFSKGMLQRIGLAQAIMHDPKLVLMDEPLGGLDPLGRKEVRDITVRLREEGKTVFLSSHILQDIEMICDRVAIIVNGEIINQGRLHDLISQKILFTEITLSGIEEKELGRFGEVLTTHGDQTLVKIFNEGKVEEIIKHAQSRKAMIHSLVPRTESLEDIFVSLVKPK
jgi:ABC-2 type transport system ATP-binding protein